MNSYTFEYMTLVPNQVLKVSYSADTLKCACTLYRWRKDAVQLLNIYENGVHIYSAGHGLCI